ncbi:hypothetical protein [Tunturibacter empetritectus]|uniref:Uncharacterized protein n=1 Tax=Tunturiibacter lichenicola TaxID=2051959 RepID=A0A7W8J868_9BACT|nr:hypothetical protein [Edaphobacter lichenicola]MBB5344409.1 hypothetical protein [Edaphobacter lichenicola]
MILLFVYPFESLQAPLWEVSVVDTSNNSISGAKVRESYRDYSAESKGSEADLITDLTGKVTFPARKIRASVLKRFVIVLSSATAGAHASFGPHAFVFVFGGMEGSSIKNGVVEDWTGSPRMNKSVIVVQ